jgi:hypothetical protein
MAYIPNFMGGSLIEFEEFSRLSTEIDPGGPFPGTANVPHFAYLLRRCRASKSLADHDCRQRNRRE